MLLCFCGDGMNAQQELALSYLETVSQPAFIEI